MNIKLFSGLIALCLFSSACSSLHAETKNAPRALYTYSFGGIEKMSVKEAVQMLDDLGYVGLAVEARGKEALARLDQFYKIGQRTNADFQIPAAFMAHRYDKYGFDDSAHKAAIDHLAPHNGTLWVWTRDNAQDGSVTAAKVDKFITGIANYAISKGVKIVLYPHYNTFYQTVEEYMPLVKKINHPSVTIAVNLCHELMSKKHDKLEATFAMAKGHIGAIILSGARSKIDFTSVKSANQSTILSLEESGYDLRPFMRLIKSSGYQGPIGFINFNLEGPPKNYLKKTMTRWQELCNEVGLLQ